MAMACRSFLQPDQLLPRSHVDARIPSQTFPRSPANLQNSRKKHISLICNAAGDVPFKKNASSSTTKSDEDNTPFIFQENTSMTASEETALMKSTSQNGAVSLFPEGFLDEITSIKNLDWVTIVPNQMLPPGDRLVLNHNNEEVMLVWLQNKIYAFENRCPVTNNSLAGAEITEEGIIICPKTQSKFDIKTGAMLDWLPNNPLLRLVTPALSDLTVYAVKVSPDHIYINTSPLFVGGYYPLAEFTGNRISTDPNYEKPIIFDDLDLEFGFTSDNEIANGRAAMLGFLALILFEITTGEGFLKEFGILDFLYQYLPDFPLLRY